MSSSFIDKMYGFGYDGFAAKLLHLHVTLTLLTFQDRNLDSTNVPVPDFWVTCRSFLFLFFKHFFLLHYSASPSFDPAGVKLALL